MGMDPKVKCGILKMDINALCEGARFLHSSTQIVRI